MCTDKKKICPLLSDYQGLSACTPEELFERKETVDILQKATAGLPRKIAESAMSHFFDGLGIIEIAEERGVTRQAIHNHVRKATRLLRYRTGYFFRAYEGR